MHFKNNFPTLSKFIYGTARLGQKEPLLESDIKMARYAMEKGIHFHTSQEYASGGTFMVLRQAFDEAPSQKPPCIVKIRCDSPRHIKFDVEDTLRRLDIDSIDVAQLCRSQHDKREIVDDILSGGPGYEVCTELEQSGKVKSFALEIFSTFSQDAVKAVKNDIFAGCIFYYNILERQVSPELFSLLKEKKTPILSLRINSSGITPDTTAGTNTGAERLELINRAKRIAEIYKNSGCKDWLEFNARYIYSDTDIVASIGATANPVHLDELLTAVNNTKPLNNDVISAIQQLHDSEFAE